MALCTFACATPKANSYGRFAEKVNGRSAMQGMLWGATNFANTHHGIIDQLRLPQNDLAAVGVVGAVALGTAITHDFDDVNTKFDEFFSPEAEELNSRVAMMAFPLAIALSQIVV